MELELDRNSATNLEHTYLTLNFTFAVLVFTKFTKLKKLKKSSRKNQKSPEARETQEEEGRAPKPLVTQVIYIVQSHLSNVEVNFNFQETYNSNGS